MTSPKSFSPMDFDSLEKRLEAAGTLFKGVVPPPEGKMLSTERFLAEELPVSLIYNGAFEHGTMMLTPLDLEDFALGISLSERIIKKPEQLQNVAVSCAEKGITLNIQIDTEPFRRLLRGSSRASVAGSACGLCGSKDETLFDASLPQIEFNLKDTGVYSLNVIEKVVESMRDSQILNQKIGMLHAAIWADKKGNILYVREDIGRHNALDKLIGALKYAGIAMEEGFCCLTSRCSYEMTQKAVLAGMHCLVAISAPSAYAVRLARQAGLTLLAPAQGKKKMIFSVPERLSSEEN
ncbi:formate dehydrogenase accessory sulfurtransferase FdhD [Acetobacteraceae bacterium]|nr:formate dehydrogenase accessory sulfurtransferase FdhD [Acetobacteraceae bacterium]